MTGATRAKTVVVGYDGSDGSTRALDWALQRAGTGGRVVVVDATRPQPDRLAHPSVGAMLHDRVLECNATVELVFLDHAALGGPELVGEVAQNFPSTALLEAARRHDADEIVVGHRDRSRVRQLSGSVSAALLRQRDRPAIVIVP